MTLQYDLAALDVFQRNAVSVLPDVARCELSDDGVTGEVVVDDRDVSRVLEVLAMIGVAEVVMA